MIKQYGNKTVNFIFCFASKGQNLIDILENHYRKKIKTEHLLTKELTNGRN